MEFSQVVKGQIQKSMVFNKKRHIFSSWKHICTPYDHCSIIYNGQTVETT